MSLSVFVGIGLVAISASGLFAAPPIQVDPATGTVTVETKRFSARLTGGTLTFLRNKLSDRVMVDVTLNPEISTVLRTGLYVEDQPLAEPFWIVPRLEGEVRSRVDIDAKGGDTACVTFTGLVRADDGATYYPDAKLTVTVDLAPKSGDLLVRVSGESPKTPVVGTAFAYSGLMTRSIDYAVEHSGLLHRVDLAKEERKRSVLEWSNISHDKRTGLGGFIWHAPVTVQASADKPQAAFAIWAEDDVPLAKYLVRDGKDNAYVTYSIPPYDDNHTTTSVTWRVNVYQHGWTEAATPFADSLARRGATQNRAPWAKDITLIVFMAGQGEGYLKSLLATFPPECRPRILLWYPQSWRTLTNTLNPVTHDAYYWDNNYSEKTAADIKAATDAGFRVSVYTNPHYNWGSADQVIDPEIRKVVAGFAAVPLLDTVSRRLLKYGANNIAYTPYREHMLNTFRHILTNLDVNIYLDTTHQFMLDGRGRLDGLTSYDGAIKLFKGVREIKKDQFLGTEILNELAVMGGGCDYSLFFDLHWTKGWEERKARDTHPIVSYLYRDTSVQVSQRVNPWSYGGVRYYHLLEEISERIGTIATTEWIHQGQTPVPETPEQKHWLAKVRLFATRGLRPYFPAEWEPGVMSYLKAADGTVFVYEETDYGSRLVERTPKGPRVHSGRVWKTNALKTKDGQLLDWIGRADDGTWIGLDNLNGFYVLVPKTETDPRLRIRSLPKGICLRNVTVTDSIALLELAPVVSNAAPASTVMGFAASNPVFRVAVPGQSSLPVKSGNEVTVPLNTPVAFIWTDGVIAPFEHSDDFVIPAPAEARGTNELYFGLMDHDSRWNADLTGPRNARPGSVYTFTVKARKVAEKPGELVGFVCGGGKSPGLFQDYQSFKVADSNTSDYTFAGLRTLAAGGVDRQLFVRMYSTTAVDVTGISPVRILRPVLGVSDASPIDLGQVKAGTASGHSPVRSVFNAQKGVGVRAGASLATVLCGTAHLTVPDEKKPNEQTLDDVGVTLVGEQAGCFELAGQNATPDGRGVKLIGADAKPGLQGGEQPESESFTVRFRGGDKPGTYAAVVRVVTQAGNAAVLSAGAAGQPLANLTYTDIPVTAEVIP